MFHYLKCSITSSTVEHLYLHVQNVDNMSLAIALLAYNNESHQALQSLRYEKNIYNILY